MYVGVYKKLDRMTVAEAADRLGVKEQAVRKRIQRGTIEYDKDEDGRVYVYVDPPDNGAKFEVNGNGTGDSTDTYTLTEALREQIDQLRRDVEDWKEEARRKDTIIMSLTQRIPELEAPREAPQTPESSPVASESASPRSDTVGAQEGVREFGRVGEEEEGAARRSWWRRWFGFE
ncbi:MAG: hypothetical protein CYG60_00680 [Actinobacteria bacterium]|nr:MAG: hypothetical protein CYG60_00680 [Actinomycetota bacterium]